MLMAIHCYQMHNATYGDLKAHTKDKEGHDAIDDLFIMRPDIAYHAVGIQITNKDQDTNTDNGKQ